MFLLLILINRLSYAPESVITPKVNIPRPMTKVETIYGQGQFEDSRENRHLQGITSYNQAPSGHEVKLEHVAGYHMPLLLDFALLILEAAFPTYVPTHS